jgi:hypothetical protein
MGRKGIILISILLANLAWLLNPHACCPREARICPDLEQHCGCGINSLHTSDRMNDCKPVNASKQPLCTPVFSQESQFSKGVMASFSDAFSNTIFLFQASKCQITAEIKLADSIIPRSATIPHYKKPPRI